MGKIGRLACKVGSYQKDGVTKGKYVDVGVLMQSQDGSMYVLMNTTFNPAGVPNPENKESIIVSVFMDNQQQQQNTQPQQQQGYQQPQQQYQQPVQQMPQGQVQQQQNQQGAFPVVDDSTGQNIPFKSL